MIDSQAAMKLQSELMPGETIEWAAMPNPGIIFHSDDWAMLPFSLLWGGFSIFWEAGVLGLWDSGPRTHPAPDFMALFGIPFVLMGQYFIWGRFFFDGWLKRRTYYAVTNRRVLFLQEGWKRKTRSCYIDAVPEIAREGEQCGTLWLGPKLPFFGMRNSTKWSMSRFDLNDSTPVLADIEEVDSVYRLIMNLRDAATKAR